MKESSIDKLIAESLAIEAESAKDAGTLGYMARSMVQATMPHKKSTDLVHERVNGNYHLTMIASPSIGLPYGSVPRLMLAWIGAEAVKTRQRELSFGDSMSEFLRTLGLFRTGGRWGDITRLKDQSMRLFSCTITTHYRNELEGRFKNQAPFYIGEADLWWDAKAPDQVGIFDTSLKLSDAFYQEVTERPVPVDIRVLKMLKRSPLSLDIYTWLSYRIYTLNHSKRDTMLIEWGSLQAHFGSGYAMTKQGTRDFKKAFLRQLTKVHSVAYPDARISHDRTGLTLKRSPLHLPVRAPKKPHQ